MPTGPQLIKDIGATTAPGSGSYLVAVANSATGVALPATLIQVVAAGVTGLNGLDLGAKSISLTSGTVTASAPPVNFSQTWNNAAVAFRGFYADITKTAAAAGSSGIRIDLGGSAFYRVELVSHGGYTDIPGITSSSNSFRGVIYVLPSSGAAFGRLGAGSGVYAGMSAGDGTTCLLTVGANGQLGFSISSADQIQNYPETFFTRVVSGVFGIWRTDTSTGGGFAFKQAITNISANTDDLALPATQFSKLNCTSACNLTGVAPHTGAHVDGRVLVLTNSGTNTLTLKHNTTSSAANRMYMSTGADIALAVNQRVVLTYDAVNNGSGAAGWRCSAAS